MMKPFDLEEAKAGKPVCTRDGDPARIVCFDKKSETHPIGALVDDDGAGDETFLTFKLDGRYMLDDECNSVYDLFMAEVKHAGYAALYKHISGIYMLGSTVYDTEEQASSSPNPIGLVAIVPIEWEE